MNPQNDPSKANYWPVYGQVGYGTSSSATYPSSTLQAGLPVNHHMNPATMYNPLASYMNFNYLPNPQYYYNPYGQVYPQVPSAQVYPYVSTQQPQYPTSGTKRDQTYSNNFYTNKRKRNERFEAPDASRRPSKNLKKYGPQDPKARVSNPVIRLSDAEYPPPPFPPLVSRKSELLNRLAKQSIPTPTFTVTALADKFICSLAFVYKNNMHTVTGGYMPSKKASEHHASWKALEYLDTLTQSPPETASSSSSSASAKTDISSKETTTESLAEENNTEATFSIKECLMIESAAQEAPRTEQTNYKSLINEMTHRKRNPIEIAYTTSTEASGFKCQLFVKRQGVEYTFNSEICKKKKDAENVASKLAYEGLLSSENGSGNT
jgi:hypothetical protein